MSCISLSYLDCLTIECTVFHRYLYCVDAKSLKVLQYRISDGTKKVLGSTDVYGANTNTKFPFGLAVDVSCLTLR